MMTRDVSQELLNEAQTAKFLGMSRQWLRKGRMNGPLPRRTPTPPFIKAGRTIRYSLKDLYDWIDNHRRVPTNPGEN